MDDRAFSPDGFRPAWWLPGRHLQTCWGRVARSRSMVETVREILPTPDGDELVLDHLPGPAGSPRAILFHGLEGSSFSVYIQGLLLVLKRRGWRATAVNCRSCARDLRDRETFLRNHRPRLYHSGETADPDLVIRTMAAREPSTPLVAAGVSLGGNALLKWLGENPGQAPLSAAVGISVPFDLLAGARFMEAGLGPLYVTTFLRTLREKALDLLERFPEAKERIDVPAMKAARNFFDFDEAATAPLHGFSGAEDYYARSSSMAFLPRITTPVLCLAAEDDPFVPARILPSAREALSPSVRLAVTPAGGHVGWVAGPSPSRAFYWGEETAIAWLADRVGADHGA